MDGTVDGTFNGVIAALLIEHLLPIVASVVLAAGGILMAKLSSVAKDKLNIDIDAKLNALLHSAINRLVEALLAKYGSAAALTDVENAVDRIAKQVSTSNPDAILRFGLGNGVEGPELLKKLIRDSLYAQASVAPVAPIKTAVAVADAAGQLGGPV